MAGGDAGRQRTVGGRDVVFNGGNCGTEGFYGVKQSRVICVEGVEKL